MDHHVPLIATIAAGFGLALIFGFIAVRIKMPALIGYLLAGILIGPFTPGLVADANIAKELAEIGVMLLMFGVGLHFSLNDLLEVRKIALPGAVLQIAVATAMGAGIATLWGWADPSERKSSIGSRMRPICHDRSPALQHELLRYLMAELNCALDEARFGFQSFLLR